MISALAQKHMTFWLARLDEPCFVYIIQGDPGTPVKIGVAKDIKARVDTLQTGNPQVLNLLDVFAGGVELEHDLHYKLKRDKIRGEWFHAVILEKHRVFLDELQVAMMAACDRSGRAPSHKVFDGGWRVKRSLVASQSRVSDEVTVRYVDPNPQSTSQYPDSAQPSGR